MKVITGDNEDTTNAIAKQAGIMNHSPAINGVDITSHSEEELLELSRRTTLFTRMFPEAKLRMVKALKRDDEVVAMLGDGVNDAPALKAAHIGVAMGTKGTEIAKAAAALVIERQHQQNGEAVFVIEKTFEPLDVPGILMLIADTTFTVPAGSEWPSRLSVIRDAGNLPLANYEFRAGEKPRQI